MSAAAAHRFDREPDYAGCFLAPTLAGSTTHDVSHDGGVVTDAQAHVIAS